MTRLRASTRRVPPIAAAITSLAGGWLVFALLIWSYGESPRSIAALLLSGTWGVAYGIGQVLYKATALLLTGVAVDLALRAGLFNIGAEGQLAVAGLALASAGARLPIGTPPWVAIPCLLTLAAASGAAWAAFPAFLRARYGGHEVIATIMTNRIADVLVAFALARGLALPGTVRTPDVVASARLARLDALGLHGFQGSAVSLALPLAVAVAGLVAFWFRRARAGRETLLVGMASAACAAERIPVKRRLAFALLLSGAIAGLASVGPVLGFKGYYEGGLAAGAGFGGIAVAILGKGSLVGLCLAALLFGTLDQGGLAINARVPMEVTTVLEGLFVLTVALSDARLRAALGRGGSPT